MGGGGHGTPPSPAGPDPGHDHQQGRTETGTVTGGRFEMGAGLCSLAHCGESRGLSGEERGPSIPESSLLLLPGAPGPLGQTSRWPSAPGPTVGRGEVPQGRKGHQRVGGSKVTQSAVSSRPPGSPVQYLVSSPPHSSSLVNPVGQEALALLREGGERGHPGRLPGGVDAVLEG